MLLSECCGMLPLQPWTAVWSMVSLAIFCDANSKDLMHTDEELLH